MPGEEKRTNVVLMGDSTLDNPNWVEEEELSVVEHLKVMNPELRIFDHSNDGFTTTDCLKGNFRNKVVPTSAKYPAKEFSPLTDAKEDIANADRVVLSVGGNNIREFLHAPHGINPEAMGQEFRKVLEVMVKEYIEIVTKIRGINNHAQIILMTQYYPSTIQKNYKIYESMAMLGPILKLGEQPLDVIHTLMQEIYPTILKGLQAQGEDNVAILDLTSSLNPFDKKNHSHQIEPSGVGGRKIADMLTYILNRPAEKSLAYQFRPDFFTKPNPLNVIEGPIKAWMPNHPNTFKPVTAAASPVSFFQERRATRTAHREKLLALESVKSDGDQAKSRWCCC